MNKILGIDLGTTYSCVSYVNSSGKPVVLKNSEGELTTPSVVFFESENTVVVGNSAKESSKIYPGDVVSFAKRSIGRAGAGWDIKGALRTPEEVLSYVIKKLVNDASCALKAENKLQADEAITQVVITCPAYFGVAERECVRKAGQIASLEVVNIINEPTAAAITYGIADATKSGVVLVYDLGGGTFDVTMIDVQPDVVRVICTGGDHMLGGKLWDDRIIEYIASEFAGQTGNTENILDDPETLQELYISAERAKKMLTAREKAPISINYKGERARVELTREQFEVLTADLLERTIMLARKMLQEAAKKGYSCEDIKEILLVGGSTRMPQIIERVKAEFSADVKIYDPDEAVAKGAALYANRQAYFNEILSRASHRAGKSEQEIKSDVEAGITTIEELAEDMDIFAEDFSGAVGTEIINVTSRSFGTIALKDAKAEKPEQILYNMILKNAELPVIRTQQFYTAMQDQKVVNIRVLESLCTECEATPEEGAQIGETVLELPEGLPANSPLEIEFKLNESGLLEIRATDISSGRDVITRFETTGEISKYDIDQAKIRMEETAVF